jgi:hypothetical protein
MKALKEDCITHSRPQRCDWVRDYDPMLPLRLPPPDVLQSGASKAFQNFGSPAAMHRPGLVQATLSLPPISNDHTITTVAGEGKWKWVDDGDDVVMRVDAVKLNNARWHSVDDEFTAGAGGGASLPSKPSMHVLRFYFSLLDDLSPPN